MIKMHSQIQERNPHQICFINSNTIAAIVVNVCKFVNLSTLLQDAAQQAK